MIALIALASGLLFAAVAALVARANRRPVAEGLALGFFLGLIGVAIEVWLAYHAAAKEHRQTAHLSRETVRARAAQPLGRGATPLHRGEAGRMLADLKRDQES